MAAGAQETYRSRTVKTFEDVVSVAVVRQLAMLRLALGTGILASVLHSHLVTRTGSMAGASFLGALFLSHWSLSSLTPAVARTSGLVNAGLLSALLAFGMLSPATYCVDCNNAAKILLVAGTLVTSLYLLLTSRRGSLELTLYKVLAQVPFFQIGLSLVKPEMCQICLLAGTLALAAIRCQEPDGSETKVMSPLRSSLLYGGTLCLFFTGLCIQTSNGGIRDSAASRSLQGTPVAKVGLPNAAIKGQSVILLTVPRCPWCAEAISSLKAQNIRFSEVGTRSLDRDNRFFDITVGPQLLIVKEGIIIRHSIGYHAETYKTLGKQAHESEQQNQRTNL